MSFCAKNVFSTDMMCLYWKRQVKVEGGLMAVMEGNLGTGKKMGFALSCFFSSWASSLFFYSSPLAFSY